MYRYCRLLFCLLGLLLPSVLLGASRKKEQPARSHASATSSSLPSVTHLTVEGRDDPLGLDDLHPRFGWQIADSATDLVQRGYRLLVASHPDTLRLHRGDIWDSGAVHSTQSQWVPYGGPALRPNQECYWQVRVVTNHGTTEWSAPARWSVGLLSEGQWRGQWVGCDRAFAWDDETEHSRLSARYLRRTFALRGRVRRATLHIAGLGRYEAYINGQRVGTQALAPAPTDYRHSIIYNTYDVTALLPADAPDACLAVVLGNGRYYAPRQHTLTHRIPSFGYPKLRAQLVLDYADGTQAVVVTDETWKLTAAGPIRTNNEWDGETYDAARLALMSGWMWPDYNDDFWLDAELVSVPEGELRGNLTPSVAVVDTLRPVAMEGQILDFGRLFTGRLRLPLAGRVRRGDDVTLRYAADLDDDGALDFVDYAAADAADHYIASGADTATWTPSFVTHTFRYAELSGYPLAAATDIVAEVISDPARRTGYFSSSDSALNRRVEAAYHQLRADYQGMPLADADNPQPWLAPRALTCVGESYLVDNATLYAKWLDDIAQAQRSDGALPDVAPAFWRSFSADTLGPSLLAVGAQMLYDQFGDERPLRRHAAAVQRWREYVASSEEAAMAEYNLPMDSVAWCFARVGGLRPLAPGYQQFLLAPEVGTSGLTHASVSYESTYGRIVSRWQVQGDHLAWLVEVPGNTTARLVLPDGVRFDSLQGLPKSARRNRRDRSVTLGSGRYALSAVWSPRP
jgi:alpha-L-rhamnosidase